MSVGAYVGVVVGWDVSFDGNSDCARLGSNDGTTVGLDEGTAVG